MSSRVIGDLGKSVRVVIDQGGYAFHHRVVVEAESAFKAGSRWALEAVEFPVRVGTKDSRIDLLLRHIERPYYLAIECKRVNPALAQWVFFRFPTIAFERSAVERIQADGVMGGGGGTSLAEPFCGRSINDRAYHLGLVIKTDAPGDETGKNREELEKATTQAHLGANGLLERWTGGGAVALPQDHWRYVIPAVFTTATVIASNLDLGASTSLESGTLLGGPIHGQEVGWLFLQSAVSLGIRAGNAVRYQSPDLALALDREMIRTVPIVSAKSIAEFLKNFDPEIGTDPMFPHRR